MSTVECCKFFLFSYCLFLWPNSLTLTFLLSLNVVVVASTIGLRWVVIVVVVAVIDWWPQTEYPLISPTLVKIEWWWFGVAAGHRLLALLEWILSLKLQWLAGLSDNAGFVIGCCLAMLGLLVAPHCVLRDFLFF